MSSVIRKSSQKKPKRGLDTFLENNTVSLVHGGKEFFTALKELIDGARHSVHLQTYIFDDDETGQYIANALMEAAKRNVAVYLLVDGYASQKLSKDFIAGLREAGVSFRFFEPFLKSKYFYFGRRLHHKVVVVDGIRGLVGSMNIADRYNDLPGQRAWMDMALYVEGDACGILHAVCWNLWGRKKSSVLTLPESTKEYSVPEKSRMLTRVRRNDWVKRKQEVYQTYTALFRSANKNITIVCSYFLPGRLFRRQLKKAASRGVDIKLVLAKTSDVKVVKNAERYLYRWLVQNKIQVYEYKPSVLHAKMAVVDGHFITLGSYNLNELSAYASVELNLDVKDEPFAEKLQKEIDILISKDCESMDLAVHNNLLFSFRQFIQWLSYFLVRCLVRISTFYYKQRE